VNTSWKLSIPRCPVVLNPFHIPLVNNNNNLFIWTFINLFEQLFILSVYENSFE
jgi:hypothetical protein